VAAIYQVPVGVIPQATFLESNEHYQDRIKASLSSFFGSASTQKYLDRNGLDTTMKQLEADQETVRNKRQMASTSFQNFDQKANQLYNLMSTVLKAMNEMRSSTIRNML
jgi:hypothetical protein